MNGGRWLRVKSVVIIMLTKKGIHILLLMSIAEGGEVVEVAQTEPSAKDLGDYR